MLSTNEKKPLRLRKRAEFLALRNGEKRRGPLFLLEVKEQDASAKEKNHGAARIGFTVSKKNGNAVKRNRIKRRLREAVRISVEQDLAQATDYVFVARPDILHVPFEQLVNELKRRIRRKAQIIKPQLDSADGI